MSNLNFFFPHAIELVYIFLIPLWHEFADRNVAWPFMISNTYDVSFNKHWNNLSVFVYNFDFIIKIYFLLSWTLMILLWFCKDLITLLSFFYGYLPTYFSFWVHVHSFYQVSFYHVFALSSIIDHHHRSQVQHRTLRLLQLTISLELNFMWLFDVWFLKPELLLSMCGF